MIRFARKSRYDDQLYRKAGKHFDIRNSSVLLQLNCITTSLQGIKLTNRTIRLKHSTFFTPHNESRCQKILEEGKEKLFLLAYLQEETISRVVFRRPATQFKEIKM